MANPPRLTVSDLADVSAEEQASTSSPARGAQMRDFLQARLQKNRAPPLVHAWCFWHDRQHRPLTELASTAPTTDSNASGSYEDRLVLLAPIVDVRAFWNVFNNFDVSRLPLRDSVHLFHKGIKPVWEDPRNAKGGSWTFRVPKSHAADFWMELCMMAIGEQLQAAVESPRQTFRDDICGVSLAVRFNSMLVQVWNRDGEHEAGIRRLLETVTENLTPELRPREESYYYKTHSSHAGFSALSTTIDSHTQPYNALHNPQFPKHPGPSNPGPPAEQPPSAIQTDQSGRVAMNTDPHPDLTDQASTVGSPGYANTDPGEAARAMSRSGPPGMTPANATEKQKNEDPVRDMQGANSGMTAAIRAIDGKGKGQQ